MIRWLLFLALLPPLTPPPFTATWDGPGAATVRFSVPASVGRGCLYRENAQGNQVFLACYGPGNHQVTFGHVGPLDHTARPHIGDVYILTVGTSVDRAPLLYRLHLPRA